MASPIVIPPLIPPSPLKQVTDAELGNFAQLIYQRTGIHVSPQKKMLLSNRLRRRLRDTGIEDFSAYYQHLKRLKDTDPEWDAFLQEITTHETYLFRDESQWNWFRNDFLAGSRGRIAHREKESGRCGFGRRLAAPATSRSPPPVASPRRCRIWRSGTSRFWAPISASALWPRRNREFSGSGRCGWCPTITASGFSSRRKTPNSGRRGRCSRR